MTAATYKNMDLKIPGHYKTGVLNGDDLIFFYYDICLDNLQGWPLAYDWETVVNEFNGLADIASCDKTDIPKQLVDNQIRFTVSQEKNSDNGSKSCAFFRHLRNAFAHYSVTRQGEWYFITDYSGTEKSMYGKIKASLLKEFCFRFFDIREKIINDMENATNPTI